MERLSVISIVECVLVDMEAERCTRKGQGLGKAWETLSVTDKDRRALPRKFRQIYVYVVGMLTSMVFFHIPMGKIQEIL